MSDLAPVALDSCLVSDVLDELGIDRAGQLPDQVVDEIRPLWEGARVQGFVVTMKLAAGPAPAGSAKLHLGARAITRARPGEVIVVDAGDRVTAGAWGGLLTRAARARGVAGVVVTGGCRDVDEVRGLGFPAFGPGGAARTARGRVHEQSCGEPVLIGSTMVATGDWVIADGSGVVFVPAAHVPSVLDRANRLAADEQQMVAALDHSDDLSIVFGPGYEDRLTGTAET